MALAATTTLIKRTPGLFAGQITTGTVMWGGGYAAGGSMFHATAASRGRVFPWTGAVSQIPLGFTLNERTGNLVATTPVEIEIGSEGVIADVNVTGVAGDNTDVFKLVYATDDNTFTLTPPVPGIPVGIITRFLASGTLVRVYFFSFSEMALLALGGASRMSVLLGVVSGNWAAPGNMLTGYECHNHARVIATYGIVIEPLVGSGADLDINLEIDGLNVTGGVINWVLADASGDKKAGTAVTANGEYHGGSLIDVEVVVNVASTGGLMNVYAVVQLELGL